LKKSSNVPRIIDRLEAKKLVKRSSSDVDRRETVIVLTPAGLNMLEHSTDRINILMDKIMTIGEEKATALNSILDSICISGE